MSWEKVLEDLITELGATRKVRIDEVCPLLSQRWIWIELLDELGQPTEDYREVFLEVVKGLGRRDRIQGIYPEKQIGSPAGLPKSNH